MSLRQALGGVLIAAVFGGLFVSHAAEVGFEPALLGWLAALSLAGIVFAGAMLIGE